MPKRIFMIAGPNGAGKTTMAFRLVPNLLRNYEFLNADEIARGLAPMHPESVALTASKLLVKRLVEMLKSNVSFAFETTGAGINYVKHIKEAQDNGYQFFLMFLWLSNPQIAIQRVAERVVQGGHHIPTETIIRRYSSGIRNILQHYLPLADNALILDNSSLEQEKIIALKTTNRLQIKDEEIWNKIQRVADV